jgi:hypothetical protein
MLWCIVCEKVSCACGKMDQHGVARLQVLLFQMEWLGLGRAEWTKRGSRLGWSASWCAGQDDRDARSPAGLGTRRRATNLDHAVFPEPHRPILWWARTVLESHTPSDRTGKEGLEETSG